jgi:hypothetical protein
MREKRQGAKRVKSHKKTTVLSQHDLRISSIHINCSPDMHLLSLLVVLGFCSSAWAAPVEQQPLASNNRHAGPRVTRGKPYTPGHHDNYDGRIDSVGKKLQPLPYVSCYPIQSVCLSSASLSRNSQCSLLVLI